MGEGTKIFKNKNKGKQNTKVINFNPKASYFFSFHKSKDPTKKKNKKKKNNNSTSLKKKQPRKKPETNKRKTRTNTSPQKKEEGNTQKPVHDKFVVKKT